MMPFSVTIEVEAPLLTAGIANIALGLDAQQLFYDKKPVVPGSLVRGVLRHAWRELTGLHPELPWPVEYWLGSEGGARGKLLFPHFFRVQAKDQTVPCSDNRMIRISIDEETGTTAEKMLQVIGTPWPVGTALTLQGTVYLLGNDDSALPAAIEKGLYWAGAIGAEKGVGFGRIVHSSVSRIADKKANLSKPSRKLLETKLLNVSLTFDSPVCFAKPHNTESAKPHNTESANRFDSEEHMPGAALLAVLRQRGLSGEIVNKLSVTHVQPLAGAPLIPMSWVWCKGGFANAASESSMFLLKHEHQPPVAPVFSVDWKQAQFDLAIEQIECRQPAPAAAVEQSNRWLEVRTAIRDKSNQAKTSQLFSLNCVRATPDAPWVGQLDMSGLGEPARKQVIKLINNTTLGPFGKTDAIADCKVQPSEPEQTIETKQRYALVLLSDAALLCPEKRLYAQEAYADYWRKAIGDKPIEFEQCFLDEYLGGGEYLHRRFNYNSAQYRPQLLARRGTVFVLRCTDGQRVQEARELIQSWIENGLPEPAHFKDNWQNKPWAHANGYGRVGLCPDPEPLTSGWAVVTLQEQEG